MQSLSRWNWDHTYRQLPEVFHSPTRPTSVKAPRLVVLNEALAISLGLDPSQLENSPQLFTGNELPQGAEPLAQAYAGHQFGHFTNLGDGRAILLGEHLTPPGERFDIQLKGSGRTPYSRGGDGLATLGPMLREYLISEAMHALGIPTTRSLAVAATGENVTRQQVLPGAVLTRVAASHLRVGTFQYAAALGDPAALTALADYTIHRHFPELLGTASCYLDFLTAVMARQASLMAQWLHVGFVHGVMNTDNMAISGETIDYGPCAFIDDYAPATVFSSIDSQGRYAYDQQPQIARWNLARLAEALLPLLHSDRKTAVELANHALTEFQPCFQAHESTSMRAKLGLFTTEPTDAALGEELLTWMHLTHQDFTNTFRHLSHPSAQTEPTFIDAGFLVWHAKWAARLTRQPQSPTTVAAAMAAKNPSVIPRNHKVEQALTAAVEDGDLSHFHRLRQILATPYAATVPAEFTTPPPANAPAYQTYCGT